MSTNEILTCIASFYGLEISDITGCSKDFARAKARHIFIWFMIKHKRLQPKIVAGILNKHVSTVSVAVTRVRNEFDLLIGDISALEMKLNITPEEQPKPISIDHRNLVKELKRFAHSRKFNNWIAFNL